MLYGVKEMGGVGDGGVDFFGKRRFRSWGNDWELLLCDLYIEVWLRF